VLALQLATVALVLEYGGDEDTVIAAAVDAAADTANSATALVQIKQIFGADVAELVEWTSWLKQIDPWEQRDRAWTKTILEAPQRAIIVGVCWRMASLEMLSRRYRSGGTGALERAGRERDRLLWIHRALAKAFRSVETAPLIDAWELVISDLERRKDSSS
jgi:(p)ppGpp synthase/HD superfamily hydrolase